MAITIYGDSISGNCLKVKWTCDLLGVSYRWIEVDVVKGEARSDALRALNPAAQVPTVVMEGGRPLAQSNAIMVHLAEGSRLIPTDAYARAKMFEWLFWEQYSHEPYIAVRRFQIKYLGTPADHLDPKLKARGDAALRQMEAWLETSPYLVGGALTCADISLVAYTRMATDGGFELGEFPAVKAWVDRVDRELGLAPYG
jgi:glutathione S-transferase